MQPIKRALHEQLTLIPMIGNASVAKLRLRSSRARSALFHANLKTVGAVRRSLENGELQQYRNCGPKTLTEICKAVGFKP
jgi:hypothetical protein